MEHLTRNITIITFIILTGVLGFTLFYNRPTPQEPNGILPGEPLAYTYSSGDITFTYPAFLTVDTEDKVTSLHHEIPYKNTGGCDMVGEEQTYDVLTDFHITFRISSTSLVQTVRQMSSYIPEENFDGDVLKINPGFIDPFEVKALKGFAIYEGAEGCGYTTHYFPLPDNRTLIVQKESIQALSGVRGEARIANILAIPGALSKETSSRIFLDILNSLIVK